jgi:hypothetical protein
MENSPHEKRFPRYLSSPLQVFFFETDEIGIIFFFLLLTQLYSSWVTYALLFAGPWIYKNLKRNRPRGFFRHMLFFSGVKTPKHYPNYFVKSFRE